MSAHDLTPYTPLNARCYRCLGPIPFHRRTCDWQPVPNPDEQGYEANRLGKR